MPGPEFAPTTCKTRKLWRTETAAKGIQSAAIHPLLRNINATISNGATPKIAQWKKSNGIVDELPCASEICEANVGAEPRHFIPRHGEIHRDVASCY